MTTNTYAVDFETYYDDELSVKVQGAVNYATRTEIYMVSIYGPDVEYVGLVEKAPWLRISGEHWVSHNAGFDSAVFAAAVEKGQISPGPSVSESWVVGPSEWNCTSDLCAYLGLPRSLEAAVLEVYDVVLNKAMRGTAKKKHWPEDFTQEQQEKMLEYALRDAKYCWNLWTDLSNQWPMHEKMLSRITRSRGHQGVTVNCRELVKDLNRLSIVKHRAHSNIPWSSSGVTLSHKKIREYCCERGIPAPLSVAEKSEECEEWVEEYGDEHPIVGAIRDYRKANRLQKIVSSMLDRIMPNGRMNFGLKYFGAHTGRWSGSDGLNMQNPNKDPVFGVDIRARIIAEEGKKFVIGDLAQIEPRCIAWLVGDKLMLQALREGFGIYEAFAKATGIWDGPAGSMKKTHKDLYALAKAQVLALGYGCGPNKFILMAKLYADLDITLEESKFIVMGYRAQNWRVTNEWARLESDMIAAWRKRENPPIYSIQLPSGRALTYSKLNYKTRHGEDVTMAYPYRVLHAHQGRGKEQHVFWGGKLFENVVQATARDVLAYAILNLESAGIPVLWSAHDEVICEVPEDFDVNTIKQIMTQTPLWLEGLVLDAEVKESKFYTK